ncbi:chemotaxis protein CheB [Thiohalobacter sp. IOR34]|uniref:chemotaxis protein CheB n=1 Tax=Thiohalobacter sp. IOR34 TaxID=3057176 RepID=UPI0025B25D7C|nr:chemotaxis protein CheB [Thiohalobacter sp. IOR34]WJW75797.1 chemotaxis protein CheB [Thiohalobacter sp. IOR34]
MPDAASALRVALIVEPGAEGRALRELLETAGLRVVGESRLADFEPVLLEQGGAALLLVNLDETSSRQIDRLEQLIDEIELPILFNEGGVPAADAAWCRRFITRLHRLAEWEPPVAEPPRPALRVVSPAAAGVRRLWVLGSSLGGPQALKEFLSALPADLPASFIVVQHIGAAFLPLLAEQLQRVTPLKVRVAEQGQALEPGEVVIVPVEQRFTLGGEGRVELRDEPIPGAYRPSIDDVLQQVAAVYATQAAAVIFSGMGSDGAQGVRELQARGGLVFSQSADSCVISSMPEAAQAQAEVAFSGTPQQLAARVAELAAAVE